MTCTYFEKEMNEPNRALNSLYSLEMSTLPKKMNPDDTKDEWHAKSLDHHSSHFVVVVPADCCCLAMHS